MPAFSPHIWIALIVTALAAITDLRTGLISNRLLACGAAAGTLAHLVGVLSGQHQVGDAMRLMTLGLVLGSILPLLLYRCGALGGGDVKLFAVIGLCVGPIRALEVELWSQVIALLFVMLSLLGSKTLVPTLTTSVRLLRNALWPARSREPIDRMSLKALRLAPAILAATVWVCVFDGGRS